MLVAPFGKIEFKKTFIQSFFLLLENVVICNIFVKMSIKIKSHTHTFNSLLEHYQSHAETEIFSSQRPTLYAFSHHLLADVCRL